MTGLTVEGEMLGDGELRPTRSGHALEALALPLRAKPIAGPV